MTIFQKRHYQAIAKILNDCLLCHMKNSKDIRFAIVEFSDMFLRDNENFDRNVFLEACGMKE